MKRRLHSSSAIKALLFILLIAASLTVRVAPAPYSSGSDIPQFAAFADTFLRHGLCFYMYADGLRADTEGWPYSWAYPYGPMWVLMLTPLRLLAPDQVKHFWESGTYYVYVPIDWVVAVKSLLISFDIALGVLIVVIVWRRRSFLWGYLAGTAYLLNPMTIYISAIYGMFDQIVTLFLIISLITYEERRVVSGAFTSLSLMTKQVVLPALIPELISVARNFKDSIGYLVGAVLSALAIVLPFIVFCPESLEGFIRSLTSGVTPSYTYPICYSFNGISSLATYMHDITGGDYLALIKYWYVPYLALQALVALYYVKKRDLVASSYLSYAAFIATYWRINHQYLVPLIALAILALTLLPGSKFIKALVVASSIIMPGVWPIMFPTSWWFHVHIEEPSQWWINMIDKLTLMVFNSEYYVVYSMMLTLLLYATIISWCIYGLHERNK